MTDPSGDQVAAPAAKPIPEPEPVKGLRYRIEQLSRIHFVFGILAGLGSLDSVEKLVAALSSLGSQAASVVALFQRFVGTPILYLWNAFRAVAFAIIPFETPVEWQTPILLGMFVFIIPIRLVVDGFLPMFALESLRHFTIQVGKAMDSVPSATDRRGDDLAGAVQRTGLLYGLSPIVEYIRGLNGGLPEPLLAEREAAARSHLDYLRSGIPAKDAELRAALTRGLTWDFLRAVIAIAVLIAVVVDTATASGLGMALGIVWRSAAAMVTLGPVVLIAVAIAGYLLSGLAALVGAVGGRIAPRPVNTLQTSLRTFLFQSRGWPMTPPVLTADTTIHALADIRFIAAGENDNLLIKHEKQMPYYSIQSVVVHGEGEELSVASIDGTLCPFGFTFPPEDGAIVTDAKHAEFHLMYGEEIVDHIICPMVRDTRRRSRRSEQSTSVG